MASGSGSNLFKPGQAVPKAGIYKVLHRDHRDPHEASLNINETFPACRQCGNSVRFKLLVAAEKKQDR